MKKYEIRDPIFGFIEFNEWERDIINSLPFQRLRRIRQLALTDMVYPAALYSRFEHSLGVMQKEALKSLLPEGKFPPPRQIENFLKLDDNSIWELIGKSIKNPHCMAILERKHIRSVYSTSEIPDESDKSLFEQKKEILNNHKIWYHIDKSDSAWYKMNEIKGDEKEIMIIDTDKGYSQPLSTYSRIAKNIGSINQLRIFVNFNEKEKTMEVV